MKRFRHHVVVRLFAYLFIAIIAGQAVAPLATAATTTALSNDIAKPWIKESIPWDGKWGAFNTTQSEAAGGACLLDPKGVEQLKKLLPAVETDWDHIQEQPKNKGGKSHGQLYKDVLEQRVKDGEARPVLKDSAPKVNVSKLVSSPLTKVIQKLPDDNTNSYASFVRAITSSDAIAGCDLGANSLGGMIKDLIPNPIDLFSEPAGFIVRLILFLPMVISYFIYSFAGDLSLQATFTTPHSERGDTIVTTINAQRSISSGATQTAKCKPTAGGGRGCEVNNGDRTIVCKSKQDQVNTSQLGFDCRNAVNTFGKQETSPWIQIAKVFRTMLSAVYGIIVIAIALIYLFRRNAGAAYDVKVVLPKVLGAVVLSAMAPFLIGFVITSSNFMVKGMFSGSPTGSISNMVTTSILNVKDAGSAVGGDGVVSGIPGQLAGTILPVLLLCVISFVMLMLLIVAVIKQLGLIVLIIATPFACLSFIFPKWYGLFAMWCRGLAAIAIIPVAQSIMMRTGIELSSALDKTAIAGSGIASAASALMAAVVLGATIFSLLFVVMKAKAYITGNKSGGFFQKAAGVAAGVGLATVTGGASATVGTARMAGATAARTGGGVASFAPGALGKAGSRVLGGTANVISGGGSKGVRDDFSNWKNRTATARQPITAATSSIKSGGGKFGGTIKKVRSNPYGIGAALGQKAVDPERSRTKENYLRGETGGNPFSAPKEFYGRDRSRSSNDPLAMALGRMGTNNGGNNGSKPDSASGAVDARRAGELADDMKKAAHGALNTPKTPKIAVAPVIKTSTPRTTAAGSSGGNINAGTITASTLNVRGGTGAKTGGGASTPAPAPRQAPQPRAEARPRPQAHRERQQPQARAADRAPASPRSQPSDRRPPAAPKTSPSGSQAPPARPADRTRTRQAR